MEINAFMRAEEAPEPLFSDVKNSYCMSLKCRRCGAFSIASISFAENANVGQPLNNSSSTDLSAYKIDTIAQSPPLDTSVSDAIPHPVRDALIDAYEARRPRAKCTHFRSAIEFALREIDVVAEPGDTLGAILHKAKKSYALPEPLIDLCSQVKAFGNWGLHWSETEVEDDDALAAQKIAEAILLYLFELPALVGQAKIRTESAKQAHQNNSNPDQQA
jgi:hypothetical protein